MLSARPNLVKSRKERQEDASPLPSAEGHPLADSAGSFKDDPLWDEMMRAVQNYRRELDAEFDAPE